MTRTQRLVPDGLEIQEGVDPEGWIDAFLVSARAEGFRFLDRLIDEWRSGANRFGRPGERLLVARLGEATVGCIGLNMDPYAGDGAIGRLRHLYVLPRYRSRGIGRVLVRDVLGPATAHYRLVRLRTDTEDAARFYEALGFKPVGEDYATHELRFFGAR